MKQSVVSLAAVLFCGAVLGVVALFGYNRYKAAKAEDAAYRQRLVEESQHPDAANTLQARLPLHQAPRAMSEEGAEGNGAMPGASLPAGSP